MPARALAVAAVTLAIQNGVVMAFAVIYLPLITEFGGSRAEVATVQSAVVLVPVTEQWLPVTLPLWVTAKVRVAAPPGAVDSLMRIRAPVEAGTPLSTLAISLLLPHALPRLLMIDGPK